MKSLWMSTWVQPGHLETCCWRRHGLIINNQTYVIVSHVLRSIINQLLDNGIIQDVSILNDGSEMTINVFLWMYKGYAEMWVAELKESHEMQIKRRDASLLHQTMLCVFIGASWTWYPSSGRTKFILKTVLMNRTTFLWQIPTEGRGRLPDNQSLLEVFP